MLKTEERRKTRRSRERRGEEGEKDKQDKTYRRKEQGAEADRRRRSAL